MGAKSSKNQKSKSRKNPYNLPSTASDSSVPAGHKLHNSTENVVGEAPPLCTVSVAKLCPGTFDGALKIWGIENFADSSTKADPPRFTLSAPSDDIAIFVSHVWRDMAFLSSLEMQEKDKRQRSCHGSTIHTDDSAWPTIPAEQVFYNLKAPGILKGARQLAAREIDHPLLKGDYNEWRCWMDLVCIDQYDQGHKAHVTRLLDQFVDQSASMVVLLSTSYFRRLWCVYECCCFLAKHPVSHMAVYSWAFADRVIVQPERLEGAPAELTELAGLTVASLRNFSVASAECSFECDREVLHERVLEHYESIAAFERFAKFSGILLVCWGLVMSPAVYNRGRYQSFVDPWVALASELGFTDLHDALAGFDAVDLYTTIATASTPETCPVYSRAVRTYFDANLKALTEIERKNAVKNL